ncbi:MAG: hypothetical protein K2X76_02145 [Sphingomonas sp.]|nr:hypothetical protein [Sphingomonas sp.]
MSSGAPAKAGASMSWSAPIARGPASAGATLGCEQDDVPASLAYLPSRHIAAIKLNISHQRRSYCRQLDLGITPLVSIADRDFPLLPD